MEQLEGFYRNGKKKKKDEEEEEVEQRCGWLKLGGSNTYPILVPVSCCVDTDTLTISKSPNIIG